MNGPITSYRCRSEPQIPLDVIRTMASVGSSIRGSGTSSTRTSRLPCQVTAFILHPPSFDTRDAKARTRERLPEIQVLGARVLHRRSASLLRGFAGVAPGTRPL